MDRRRAIQARLETLSPAKRRLFEQRLHGCAYPSTTPDRIRRRSGDGPVVLSFAQQRLWLLKQLNPDSAFYNLPVAHQIDGPLDASLLEKSVNEIVRRHETLRTTFVDEGGTPMQVIAPRLTLPLPIVDLRDVPELERAEAIERWRTAEAERPFDLSQGPLLRITLLRLRNDQHILLRTMHHIIADGWSIGVFTGELADIYAASAAGEPHTLPPLAIQYADYAQWQRQRLRPDVLATSLAYWKQQLAGAPPLLELPHDRPRQAVQTFHGSARHFEIDAQQTAHLNNLSRRLKVTPFVLLFTAFVTLLYRYSGQQDMVLGVVTANRDRQEIESLIGFFVNVLPFRIDLSGRPSFQELLGRVHQVALNAHPHREMPFEHLVDAMRTQRSLSHLPLVQVVFGLQNVPVASVDIPGLRITYLPTTRQTTVFDITLSIAETGGKLAGTFEYDLDLFDAATINNMVKHYQTLLQGIVESPQRQLLDFSLTDSASETLTHSYTASVIQDRSEEFNF
jgi:hypothetical protein